MQRLRSFSIKTTRILVFSFTIPSSLLFCFLFSFWVLNTTPSGLTESYPHLSGDPGTIKAKAFADSGVTLFVNGSKDGILGGTPFKEAGNFSVEALDLGKEGESGILVDAPVGEAGGSSGEALDSIDDGKVAIFNDVHWKGIINSSDEALHSVNERKNSDLAVVDLRKSSQVSQEGLDSGAPRADGKSNEFDAQRVKNEKFLAKNLIRDAKSYNASGEKTSSVGETIEGEGANTCDVSHGRWVFDESYPLYTSSSCPFIDEGFNCEANGRMDKDYMNWRWQPYNCNISRLNPIEMLELIRGKRLVFVGDSINRNQWESMLCLLQGALSDPRRVYEAHRRRITKDRGIYQFKFPDYQCSVEYYVTHFLVHESKARVRQRRVKTLRIDTIDRSSSKWRGADILVFNTAHWWSHHKTKAGVNYYQEGDQVLPHLDVSTAFRKALMTWASWVDQHVAPGKTRVFFRTSAPSHFSGGEWNSGGHCRESTQPLNDTSGRQISEKNMILEQVVKQMKTPVTILNITNLSGLRIDGHPSIYGRKPESGSPTGIQDCSHWCLPGVPDTWNELLYFHLLSRQIPVSTSQQ
ncbi:protein trichome birefringence-like 6 [Elaeis guineensis]|uniref:protein trichome birefringence-like 6 n=1 Tax=Elaeis guineensis var. tenera TaxID=51953 RepID=UPI003C6D819C